VNRKNKSRIACGGVRRDQKDLVHSHNSSTLNDRQLVIYRLFLRSLRCRCFHLRPYPSAYPAEKKKPSLLSSLLIVLVRPIVIAFDCFRSTRDRKCFALFRPFNLELAAFVRLCRAVNSFLCGEFGESTKDRQSPSIGTRPFRPRSNQSDLAPRAN
jgi:hypothetical protein